MTPVRKYAPWGILFCATVVPIAIAAQSPLLAWRDPIYIVAGFAGIIALTLLLVQPLLAMGYLPGLALRRGRSLHRWVGFGLLLAVVIHIVGLWITSPPDVIDALLLRSPTPFSIWGFIAMWAVFAAAGLAAVQRRRLLRPRTWQRAHMVCAVIIVAGTIIHVLQIEGTMGTISKGFTALLVGAALGRTLYDRAQR